MLVEALVVALTMSQANSLPTVPGSDVAAVVGQIQPVHEGAQQVSQDVANLTGAQLSPLFVMVALGGSQWLLASPDQRVKLPWHQQPWFWGTALVLLLVLWAGDKVPGARVAVKHLKLFENKLSGIIAAVALAASFARAVAHPVGQSLAVVGNYLLPSAYAAGTEAPVASVLATGAGYAVAFVLGLAVSAAVWLAGHSINVIALLNPFAPLDAALRFARLVLIVVVVGAAKLSASLGLVVSALYVGGACLVAGWAFRLMVFGAVFSSDFLLGKRRNPSSAGVEAFSSSDLGGVPGRTYGKMVCDGNGAVFRYRPWLLLREKSVPLPKVDSVGQGLVSPILMSTNGDDRLVVLRFPPRYRSQAAELAALLGGLPVVDVSVIGGFKAAVAWLTG